MSMSNLIGGAVSGVKGLLGFDSGGIVPGPMGSPQLAVVHGGETILPTHKQSMNSANSANITVNITGNEFVGEEGIADRIGNEIMRALKDTIKL